MDEKDKQLCETTLVVESAKQTAKLGKDVASDIIRPTSKSIGENIGLLVDGVFGWLGVWGQKQKIRQKKNLEEFKKEINKNIEAIPQDNLKEPTMYIVGPAIEASKYYYEETQFKEMFAKLIAASCDERKNSKIHPYFIYAIKQLTPVDATILKTFKSHQKQAIVNYSFFYKDIDSENIDYPNVFYPFNKIEEPQKYAISITNLVRVGFITLNFSRCLTNEKLYDIYFSDPFYLESKKVLTSDSSNQDYIINKGTVTLTPLGENFIELCL